MSYVSGRGPGVEPELPGPTSRNAHTTFLPHGDVMHGGATFDGLQLMPGGLGRQLEREIIPQVNQEPPGVLDAMCYDAGVVSFCCVFPRGGIHRLTPHLRPHPPPPSLFEAGSCDAGRAGELPSTAGGVAAGPERNTRLVHSTPRCCSRVLSSPCGMRGWSARRIAAERTR